MSETKRNWTPKPEWWKHLRPYGRRIFWKKVRKAFKMRLKNSDTI